MPEGEGVIYDNVYNLAQGLPAMHSAAAAGCSPISSLSTFIAIPFPHPSHTLRASPLVNPKLHLPGHEAPLTTLLDQSAK
jgi:hypothetical protein